MRSRRGCIRDNRSVGEAPRLDERDPYRAGRLFSEEKRWPKRQTQKNFQERPPRDGRKSGAEAANCFAAQGDQHSRREPVVLTAGRCRGRFSKRQDRKGIATGTDGVPRMHIVPFKNDRHAPPTAGWAGELFI